VHERQEKFNADLIPAFQHLIAREVPWIFFKFFEKKLILAFQYLIAHEIP
jgi:hypothetical protein